MGRSVRGVGYSLGVGAAVGVGGAVGSSTGGAVGCAGTGDDVTVGGMAVGSPPPSPQAKVGASSSTNRTDQLTDNDLYRPVFVCIKPTTYCPVTLRKTETLAWRTRISNQAGLVGQTPHVPSSLIFLFLQAMSNFQADKRLGQTQLRHGLLQDATCRATAIGTDDGITGLGIIAIGLEIYVPHDHHFHLATGGCQ